MTHSETKRDRSRVNSLGRALIAGLVCLPLLITAIGFVRFQNSERVLSGVRVAGVAASGADRSDVEQRVKHRGQALSREKLRVTLGRREAWLAVADLGVEVDPRGSAERALAVGRTAGLLGNVWRYVRSYWASEALEAAARFEPAKLDSAVSSVEAALIEDLPFSGGITFNGSKAVAAPPRTGRKVARAPARARLLTAVLLDKSHEPLELLAETVTPKLAKGTLERALVMAERLTAVRLVLWAGERKLELEPVELAGLVVSRVEDTEVHVTFDSARIDAWLVGKREAFEAPPRDAGFAISAKDEPTVVPAEPGARLHADDVRQALLQATQEAERKSELVLRREPAPARTTEAVQQLGIRRLVGSFTTRHACCQRRVENIQRIASLMDGLVAEPGQTISVNAVVGPRTQKNGFVAAPSIEDGEMVDTVGGGISQFATTFFNAIFHAGYDIIERQPHTYWFPRYPMAHEATLSWPKPDIVFRNDSSAGLLVKTSFTKTSITVKLFGDTGGRKVRADVSERREVVRPTLELMPNREIEPDDEKVVEGGMIGWSVIASRTVTFADGTKKEERRKVTYKPKPRRVDVHPCRIPEGEPGATGEPCPEPEEAEQPADGVEGAQGE